MPRIGNTIVLVGARNAFLELRKREPSNVLSTESIERRSGDQDIVRLGSVFTKLARRVDLIPENVVVTDAQDRPIADAEAGGRERPAPP